MKYQNYQIYLPYYWELLNRCALEEHYSWAEITMDKGAKSGDSDVAKRDGNVLFPGQVFIWETLQFDSKRKPKPISLWEYHGQDAVVNRQFINVWLNWKVRQVSSPNLVPKDLRELFIDEERVLVTDEDFPDTNEGIDQRKEFLALQRELFKEYLGWSPRC